LWAEYRLACASFAPAGGLRRGGVLKAEVRHVKEDRPLQQGVLKVKKSRVWVALASSLILTTLLVVEVSAQPGTARPAGGTRVASDIALIDIQLIFKNNTRFKQHMADLQADLQRAEEQMKKDRDGLRALSERLNEYKAGTAEYKQLEEEIAKRSADFNVRFQLQKKEFTKTEARIYYMVLQEIQQEVDAYAQANGIAAVLKFNSEQADPDKPEEVVRDLGKPVLWYARNLDITPTILESLNRRALQQGDQRSNGPVNLPQRR
jgi:Skp family chaperone for outer membrane proteins